MKEVDLLDALGRLDDARDGEELTRRALDLCLRLTDASSGWLALGASPGEATWRAIADDHAERGFEASRGIAMEAWSTGRLVVTADATHDPRFAGRDSVRRRPPRAVLCVPIRRPPIGVLYLEGGPAPTPEHLAIVSLVARLIAPYAQEALRSARWERDPTAAVRARFPAPEVVGRSPAISRLLEHLSVVAPTRVPVLLGGPTGSGKSLVARALHDAGPTAAGRFVAVDATLLSRERAASELFGARRGAWTGLTEDRDGFFEAADGGTLFLDEIGDLPLEVQPQLLTVLDEQRFHRLGETRERRSNARVVAATNADLEERVRNGAFRADLFHRIAAFKVDLPSLEARRDDIGLLAATCVDREARTHGLRALPLSPSALAWLEDRPWPGNVRELTNVVRAGLLWANAQGADAVLVGHLDGTLRPEPPDRPPHDDLRDAVRRFRQRHVERVLEESEGSVSEAARRLGIHRAHLYDLLREH